MADESQLYTSATAAPGQRPAPTAEAGGAGAGHSLPGAGSDLIDPLAHDTIDPSDVRTGVPLGERADQITTGAPASGLEVVDHPIEAHREAVASVDSVVVETDAPVVGATAVVAVPLVAPHVVADVAGDRDLRVPDAVALDGLAGLGRQAPVIDGHDASPAAPGSAHHKRDYVDGEASGDGSQQVDRLDDHEYTADQHDTYCKLCGLEPSDQLNVRATSGTEDTA